MSVPIIIGEDEIAYLEGGRVRSGRRVADEGSTSAHVGKRALSHCAAMHSAMPACDAQRTGHRAGVQYSTTICRVYTTDCTHTHHSAQRTAQGIAVLTWRPPSGTQRPCCKGTVNKYVSGGQFDFVWLLGRTPHGATGRTYDEPNGIKTHAHPKNTAALYARLPGSWQGLSGFVMFGLCGSGFWHPCPPGQHAVSTRSADGQQTVSTAARTWSADGQYTVSRRSARDPHVRVVRVRFLAACDTNVHGHHA